MLGIKIIISMIYRYITLCWHYRDLWYVISKIYAQRLVKHNVWKVNFSKNKAILKRQIKPLWKKYKNNHGMFHNLFDSTLWKDNNKKYVYWYNRIMYIKIFGNIVYINLTSSVQLKLNKINSLQHCVECYKPWNHHS